MGQGSAIEWTDHTFNPWWGCEKVSPACDRCYAEAFARRLGKNVWGKAAPRRFFGEKHWHEPLKWDDRARREGVRRRVFCASMADVFEGRADLEPERIKLWGIIAATTNLDWLLLTKRPENIRDMVPRAWLREAPANVWYGTTVENQRRADERIPHLLEVPAAVRFLSCEPLLEPVNLKQWVAPECNCLIPALEGAGQHAPDCAVFPGIHWVIVGGESGHGARPMAEEWVSRLVWECRYGGTPCFVKQLGGHPNKRGEPSAWPVGLRVREFPTVSRCGSEAR